MPGPNFSVHDYIFDADSTNFTELVIKNSALGPVLLHFWSRKAGPSFRLYPVLENLVEVYAGSFLLVNIDADENKKITHDYAITSVPTLKLFVNGTVVETLFGYQNVQDLRFMLDQYVASENDIIIYQSLKLFEQGDTEKAYQKLGKAALDSPQYYKLPLTIASLMQAEGRYDEALKLLHSLPEPIRLKPACQRLIIESEFARIASPVQNVIDLKIFVRENMDELPAVAILAAWHANQKEYESALKLFQHIMQRDRTFEDDQGRRNIVKILSLLKPDDPLADQYRNIIRKLNN